MKKWQKLAEAEIQSRLDEYRDGIEYNILHAWKTFSENGNCSLIDCRFCPFYGISCDGDNKPEMIKDLNEEVKL